MTGPGAGAIRITVEARTARFVARDRFNGAVNAQNVLDALPHLVGQLESSLTRIAAREGTRVPNKRKAPAVEAGAVNLKEIQ